MLVFENGDVFLTKDEYRAMVLKNAEKPYQAHDILEYTRKYIELYYKLIEAKIPMLAISPKDIPKPEQICYIRETDYKIFQAWRAIIARFTP